ncbi:hypothetical protein [Trebonia sp.]|uniref:hypothetical protein n=1 Tax=Trebonia sp. TaxID=2767075 RepID=UPI0026160DCD|nr:hypothetical protein [Trebonia sp.]
MDADIASGDNFRVVQLTPPHSQCSISFGKGLTTAEPGSAQRLLPAVFDIDAARADLTSRGVDVSEVFHPAGGRVAARTRRAAPTRRMPRSAIRMATAGCSRRSRRGFPAGNGRTEMDVASLAALLHETAEHHDPYEKTHAPHNWWDWYAAYMDARQRGSAPEQAAAAADRYMAEVLHVGAR